MTSVVDELPTPHGDGDRAPGDRNGSDSTYSPEFVEEIRELLAPPLSAEPLDDDTADVAADDDAVVADDDLADGGTSAPTLIFPERLTEPVDPDDAPAMPLFIPPSEPEGTASPSLSGLSAPAAEEEEPAAVPNLFVPSAEAPAEVAFVPAEEYTPNRFRWLIVLIGVFAVAGAAWLTWMAQSSSTVDAPVTTVELTATTDAPAPSTTEAPTTDGAPTTAATTEASTATTATTVPATAAPAPTPGATAPPGRPVATTRRPVATTRRPVATTRPPSTAAPTTTEALTIPDVSFSAPTIAPTTAPPTTAAPTTAAPTTAAPTTPAPTTAAPTTAAPTTPAAPPPEEPPPAEG